MKTVAIVGAGETAAQVARALAALDVAGEIRLIDAATNVALGKALDIQQAGPIDGFDTRVRGAADVSAAAGAAVVVVADRHGGGRPSTGEAIDLVRRIAAAAPRAPVVFASPDDRPLLEACARELRIPASRLVGSAPEALASGARALLALAAAASPLDTWLPVHGLPEAWVFAWSEATVAGRPVSAVLPPHELGMAEQRIRASWPPGPYALGSAAARLTAAMLTRSRRRFTAFALLDGEWRHRAAAASVVLGPEGIAAREEPVLSARERVQLATALSG
jgi:malate dehydrogenase